MQPVDGTAYADVMASILKLWHHTLSIEVYLLEERSCQISSRYDLKQQQEQEQQDDYE